MAYLLDTNVVSEIRKRAPNPAVEAWFDQVDETGLYLSVLTVGEIRRGVELLRTRDPEQAASISTWLDALLATYRDRIAPITVAVAEEWGRLNAIRTFPVVDGMIAATAKVHGWTVATRNKKDLEGSGVAVIDPFSWSGQSAERERAAESQRSVAHKSAVRPGLDPAGFNRLADDEIVSSADAQHE